MHCLQVVSSDDSIVLACQGYGVVRELEGVATEESDKPTHDCFIKDCGVLEANADLSPPHEVGPTLLPTLLPDSPSLPPPPPPLAPRLSFVLLLPDARLLLCLRLGIYQFVPPDYIHASSDVKLCQLHSQIIMGHHSPIVSSPTSSR